nr:15718_t:CDS:2 [Entrophospora candida]
MARSLTEIFYTIISSGGGGNTGTYFDSNCTGSSNRMTSSRSGENTTIKFVPCTLCSEPDCSTSVSPVVTIIEASDPSQIEHHRQLQQEGMWEIERLPQTSHRVMEALGLRKIGHTVYHSQTPYIVGMIIKVKELLSVRMINRIPSLEERSKRAESGYVIIKRYQDTDGY